MLTNAFSTFAQASSTLAQTSSTGTSNGDAAIAAGAVGAALLILVVAVLINLAVYIVLCIGLWKTFSKAGRPGWEGIVPFYNLYILVVHVARLPWFWALGILLAFVPFIGGLLALGVFVYISLEVAKNFGRSTLFGVGLGLLSPIFYCILGFGDSKFQPSKAPALPGVGIN